MKQNLNNKKILFVGWGVENKQDTYMHQIYYLVLKKIFPKLKIFDTKKNYFQFGRPIMNNNLLEAVRVQSPELIIFALNSGELSLETLDEIKKTYPKVKLVIIICDDDARFETWSRYYALFFDAIIASPISEDYFKEYAKDGIKNIFSHWDYNTYKLKPMHLVKKYDITFIGRPKADRNDIFRYLLANKINISLFGWEWDEYPEFKKIYKGPLNPKDYVKIINQSKINLSPTRAGYSEQKKRFNFKGRFFEVALCNSFQLIEECPIIHKFFKKDEVGMFTTKEDLVIKINYYLKNEKEREAMAERAYEKVIKNYNREKQLTEIFSKIIKIKSSIKEKFSYKKIKNLKEKDFFLSPKDLSKKLKGSDYVGFDINKNKRSKYKDSLQILSIERTGMPISCCDYYGSFFNLEEHMLFQSKISFERIGEEANKLINLNQLVIKKEFFLRNFYSFKELSIGKNFNLISLKNTSFISIPLVTISSINIINYEDMKKAFYMKFQDKLLTIFHQKKFYTFEPYKFLFLGIFGKGFILKYVFESFFKRSNWAKLSLNKTYFSNSVLKKKPI